MALSETWLKAQLGKDREKLEEFTDRDAMGVRITPKGKIIFQLRYRYKGKQQRIDLGSYPNLSLKNARIEADRLRAELERGYDPKQVKLQELKSVQDAYTFEKLFYEWYERFCKPNKQSHHDILRSFEIYVLPKIGAQNCDNITAYQWLNLLEENARKTPTISARILINAKQCLKWGQKRGLVQTDPLSNVSAKHDLRISKNQKERALTDHEIYLSYYAVDHSRMAYKNKLFLKLLLIYGCRVGELKQAKKVHFDFDSNVWTIPAENHKTGRISKAPILRPITKNIKPYILKAIEMSHGSEYLFTADGSNGPLGESSHLTMPNNIFTWLKKHKDIEMDHWSVHDLRRTMRTNMSTIAPPHVCEIMLGHALPKVWGTYDKYSYLSEQHEAYSKWVDRLELIWKNEALGC
ncbi:tyrosine-type recombinase/integrase [Acinetobacter soli]|uniref:tyrosine-type recombinase/integrase n=1 Tax=Acinetobacter soli TaxID=487316 RepID=UPI00125CD62E|nr:integrase arm-type DNA-binding domain-containing protein [Acinetobacter soli]